MASEVVSRVLSKLPCVVEIPHRPGEFAYFRCHECKSHASGPDRYFNGLRGLWTHHTKVHYVYSDNPGKTHGPWYAEGLDAHLYMMKYSFVNSVSQDELKGLDDGSICPAEDTPTILGKRRFVLSVPIHSTSATENGRDDHRDDHDYEGEEENEESSEQQDRRSHKRTRRST